MPFWIVASIHRTVFGCDISPLLLIATDGTPFMLFFTSCCNIKVPREEITTITLPCFDSLWPASRRSACACSRTKSAASLLKFMHMTSWKLRVFVISLPMRLSCLTHMMFSTSSTGPCPTRTSDSLVGSCDNSRVYSVSAATIRGCSIHAQRNRKA